MCKQYFLIFVLVFLESFLFACEDEDQNRYLDNLKEMINLIEDSIIVNSKFSEEDLLGIKIKIHQDENILDQLSKYKLDSLVLLLKDKMIEDNNIKRIYVYFFNEILIMIDTSNLNNDDNFTRYIIGDVGIWLVRSDTEKLFSTNYNIKKINKYLILEKYLSNGTQNIGFIRIVIKNINEIRCK